MKKKPEVEVGYKYCFGCESSKLLKDFNNSSAYKDGKQTYCRSCYKIKNQQYEQTEEGKIKRRTIDQRWKKNNPNKVKEIQKQVEQQRLENGKTKEYRQLRYGNDFNYRFSNNIRSRIWSLLKGNKKSNKTQELLGCSIEELKHYLEKQFLPDMTWTNYGEWEIDHIIPIKYFDLSDSFQQQLCFHWTNLRPLWADQNNKKSCKIEKQHLYLITP